ncbi:glycosyltransferase family 9 protein [Burkholderia multivorans]|uniref:glycosyltransferase family 9 protein n=1 Tax=Burkholderia multivorans TaxID=87883 RepID=UPI001C253688|nr:glycosyltransferase family 9 protein [Burkholderia multivorans]MBU9550915.1 glycosyltransferase family 9 protein [Burkholderia multivorans]
MDEVLDLFPPHRPPRTILVVCTRRIGDVLLTTPLVRSLKARWPQAQIDMLVFRGTGGVLENNPDVRRVISVAQRTGIGERFADAARIWRRYDLACAAISSDRARFYCWFAGRKRIGLLAPGRATWFNRRMLDRHVIDDSDLHTVNSGLLLARSLGITPLADVVPPAVERDAEGLARFEQHFDGAGELQGRPYVVLHPYPMYAYKLWSLDGWVELATWLQAQGFAIALSGGPAPAERSYAEQIAARLPGVVLNRVGQLSLAESAEMIRRARLYVGPDTSATHIAAATGTPTLALFGPSDPVRWGPWPHGWAASVNPWQRKGTVRHGNVYLLQGEGSCVPCLNEGCERRVESLSECLTTLGAARVIRAASELLDLPVSDAVLRVDAIARENKHV